MEGALRPLWGVLGADFDGLGLGIFPVLLRVLLMGKAGRAIFGGPFDGRDGRDGRGSVVVMAAVESHKRKPEVSGGGRYFQRLCWAAVRTGSAFSLL